MRINLKFYKFITSACLPILLLASCGYSKSQQYYFKLIKDEKTFNKLWGIEEQTKQKSKQQTKDLIYYVGISSCPYCHALKDLDKTATDAMSAYMKKSGESALDDWFKSNTEKGYGPLNKFAKNIKDTDKKVQWNLNISGTFVTGYKVGDFPPGDNWTDGLKPEWQWLGLFIDQLKNSNAKFYNWDDPSKTFVVNKSFDYSIPMLIFAKPIKSEKNVQPWTNYEVTGYVSGYLSIEQIWQAYMQFIFTK